MSHQNDGNNTYIIRDAAEAAAAALKLEDDTVTVHRDSNLKRKSPKSGGRSSRLKENRRPTMLDIPGVCPLVPSEGSVSSVAMTIADKNMISNMIPDCNELNELKIEVDRRCTKESVSSDANLMNILNLESLKTPNLSVSLPQSWICDGDSEGLREEGKTVCECSNWKNVVCLKVFLDIMKSS